ncbi:hypothetical protein Mapa_005953 [Marchantia paleacea]|nr:hypothetical protein Mapa_005953 [Marchantia paleacea]
MRRIFPLKSTSNHGHSGGDFSGKESPRLKSRDPPEVIKRTAIKSKKNDPSTSEDMNSAALRNKREHWCPSCPAAENGVRCETPPSGDENIVAKEEEKGVISPMREHLRQSHRSAYGSDTREREADLDLDEALKSVVAGAMRSADCRVVSVDKYTSRRSGLGAVDNVVHERLNKPQVKSKIAPGPVRANSAPKVRPQAPGTAPEVPRLHSMRILKVPDRVFDAQSPRVSYSPRLSPRLSEGSSSNDSVTPRSRLSYDRRSSLNGLTPRSSHSRSYSLAETHPKAGSDKQPVTPSLSTRKSFDSPRPLRKESGPQPPLEVSEKATKYSGARIVAERLAKAFRGTSKASIKEGKTLMDADRAGGSKSSLGHPRRMFVEHSDASYDGSCSDNSTQAEENVSLLNLLPHVRAGELQPVNIRKEGSVLSWQEFVTEGKSCSHVPAMVMATQCRRELWRPMGPRAPRLGRPPLEAGACLHPLIGNQGLMVHHPRTKRTGRRKF